MEFPYEGVSIIYENYTGLLWWVIYHHIAWIIHDDTFYIQNSHPAAGWSKEEFGFSAIVNDY